MRVALNWKPVAALALFGLVHPAQAADTQDFSATKQLYEQHCSVCHSADRIGGTGPALLPESLGRIKKLKPAKPSVRADQPAR